MSSPSHTTASPSTVAELTRSDRSASTIQGTRWFQASLPWLKTAARSSAAARAGEESE